MKQKNGAWLLALAAMLCSIGGVCIKGVPWTPLAINGARNAIAACITGAFLWRAGRRLRWNGAVACGALSLALTTNLVFAGIGCFVADGLAAGTLLGNALGLGSGVAYAGVFLVNTEPEGDAMSSYFLGQVAGALIGLPFLSGETDFSFVPMVCIFALGVFQLGLSYVLIARGIATTPPMTASLVTAIEPILTPVWVALAYGERLSGFSLAGAVLVLCSVVWFNTRGRKAL